MYSGSVSTAIMTEYVEHAWQGWRFQQVPRTFWKERFNQYMFLEHIKQQLGGSMDDLYKLTTQIINSYGGTPFSTLSRSSKVSYVLLIGCSLRSRIVRSPWVLYSEVASICLSTTPMEALAISQNADALLESFTR